MSEYAPVQATDPDYADDYVDEYGDVYTTDDLLEGDDGTPLVVWIASGLYVVSLTFAFVPGMNWIPHVYALVWALAVLIRSATSSQNRLRFPTVIAIYLIWVIWSLTGLLTAALPELARPNWFMLVRMMGLMWLASNTVKSLKQLRLVLYMILVAEVAIVIVGWWQLGDLSVMRRWEWNQARENVGIGIRNANDLAFLGSFGIAASALLFFTTVKGRLLERIAQVVGVAVSLYVIWASGSRRGLLNVPFFALLIYLCHLIRRRKVSASQKIAVSALVLVVLVGLSVWIKDSPFASRLESFGQAVKGDFSGLRREPRTDLMMESLEATLKNPVFGLGPGHFRLYDIEHGRYGGQSPHSDLGAVGSESGLIGLLIYLSFWVAFVVMLLRVRKRVPPGRHEAMLNVIYAFTVLLVVNLPTQEHYRDKFVWLLLGSFMGYCLSLRTRMDELDQYCDEYDYDDEPIESEPVVAIGQGY